MKDIYFIKIWKSSKLLFFSILIFITLQVFFIHKRIQNFPFFIYDMYSRPINSPVSFTLYEIIQDSNKIDYSQFTNTKESILLNSIQSFEHTVMTSPDFIHQKVLDKRLKKKVNPKFFTFIKTGLSNSSTAIQHYLKWVHDYLNLSGNFIIQKNTYTFSDKKLLYSKTIAEFHDN